MSDTLKEDIITSPAAERFLQRVSPIYDNSFIGLWMMEVIGREYDDLNDLIGSFDKQITPDTATWGLELWEKRYGITPDPSKTLEERRRALLKVSDKPSPFTPANLERALKNLTGYDVKVFDHVDAYTFGVLIYHDVDGHDVDYAELVHYIETHKPSHLSFRAGPIVRTGITIHGKTTEMRRSIYQAGDGWNCGELPE